MSDDGKTVEGDVVGGPPPDEPSREVETARTFFHPLSGAIILGVDWLAFGLDLASGFGALAVMSVVAFVVTYVGVEQVQRKLHKDTRSKAALKALLGAIAAGVPFPVTGTIVGAFILGLSGLRNPFSRGR